MAFTVEDAQALVKINEKTKEYSRKNEVWNIIKALASIGATQAIFNRLPGDVAESKLEEAGFTLEKICDKSGEVQTIIVKW